MKVLVAGAKKRQVKIVDKKNDQHEIVGYNTTIKKSADLLRERGCQVIGIEDEHQFLDAVDNNPDLDGVIIDASFRGGKIDSLDVFGAKIKGRKLIAYILETQPSAADRLWAAIDEIEIVPLPVNSSLQEELDFFRENGRWKTWARDWVFNDAGDAVYLLLQDIYSDFSDEWWFSKAAVR